MRRIVFSVTAVRHGQAASNDIERGVVHGNSESPLTEEGKRQAAKVAESLRNEVFDAVYSSDLSRAYDTALAIVGADRGHTIETEPLLRERDFGRFENAPWSVFKQAVAKAGCESPKDWYKFEDESMESLDRVEDRAGTFLKKLFQRSASEWGDRNEDVKILVASHGIFIKRLVIRLSKMGKGDLPSPEDLSQMWIPNTGVSKLRLEVDADDLSLLSVKTRSLFCAKHLEE